jgi:hypothetical protein
MPVNEAMPIDTPSIVSNVRSFACRRLRKAR